MWKDIISFGKSTCHFSTVTINSVKGHNYVKILRHIATVSLNHKICEKVTIYSKSRCRLLTNSYFLDWLVSSRNDGRCIQVCRKISFGHLVLVDILLNEHGTLAIQALIFSTALIHLYPWLVGLGVWFSLWVREVPGSNPGRALLLG